MKKVLTVVCLTLIILGGLSLLLYPSVSDYINSLRFRRVVEDYEHVVQELDTDAYDRLMAEADEWNRELAAQGYTDSLKAQYDEVLNAVGDSMMGYVEVPSIHVVLPIYHGTADETLQDGVGHLEGSSLPVGGESTHAVLTGHTALPSAKLFTDIDQLKEGDIFRLRILDKVLTYEVDQIRKILPYEQKDLLRIEPGKDYCTLVTCTPYGVNSHRLLVRGHRVETPETGDDETSNGGDSGGLLQEIGGFRPWMLVPPAALAVLIVLLVTRHWLRKRGNAKVSKKDKKPDQGG